MPHNSPPDGVTNHRDVTERFSPNDAEQEAKIQRPDFSTVATEIPFIKTAGPRDDED